jgi:hypothetical protein
VKSNTLGFSYGYLILDAVKRADGNREIRKIDVFEISATPTPMSAETRVLDWRAPSNPSPRCHHPRSSAPAHANSSASSVSKTQITRFRNQTHQWVAAAMGHTNGTEEKQLTPSELRAKSERLAREFAPVRVATFDC